MILAILLSAVQLSGANASVEGEEIVARADAAGTCAFSLDARFPDWEPHTYVMLPAEDIMSPRRGRTAFEEFPRIMKSSKSLEVLSCWNVCALPLS